MCQDQPNVYIKTVPNIWHWLYQCFHSLRGIMCQNILRYVDNNPHLYMWFILAGSLECVCQLLYKMYTEKMGQTVHSFWTFTWWAKNGPALGWDHYESS